MLLPRVNRNPEVPEATQSMLTSFLTGPIVDNVKSEASRTGDELHDLKNSRVTPSTTTADGQPLTRMS